MKCCYIVLTCNNYLNTRAKWLYENSLFTVDQNDIYFLSYESKPPNIYGWKTNDNYEGCPLKYISFFKNMTIEYDWYFFIDDDTFVYTDRLYKFLENYDKNESLYIGLKCGNLCHMSGGAGFLITNSLYKQLIEYIRNTPENELKITKYGDESLGIWLINLDKKMINTRVPTIFNTEKHRNNEELEKCITFHYLKNEEDYKFYGSFIKK